MPRSEEAQARRKANLTAAAKARNPRYKAGDDKKGSGDTSHLPPVTPETRMRTVPICGMPRSGKSSSGPGTCCMPAGWGTDHKGVGPCKLHLGTTSTQNRKAVVEYAKRQAVIYGAPVEVDADTAVLQELYRTAGHVEWLRLMVVDLDNEDQVTKMTSAGLKPNAIIELYQKEREHLLRVAKVAKDMGIAERQTQVMEEQARLMAHVFQRFLDDPDLDLSPKQRLAGRQVMRRHLETIEAFVVEQPRELSAG